VGHAFVTTSSKLIHNGYARALVALAVACAVLATVPPAGAHAAPKVRFGLTDDAWITDGPGTLGWRLRHLEAMGVQIVRYAVRWDQVAARKPARATDPRDPAYDWSTPDKVLRGLRRHHIEAIVQLVGTPSWANGGRTFNYAPTSRSTFAEFATAAAHRYSSVHRWLIWNEPNQVRWLRPTSAVVYTKRLLNPAYTAIHRVIPGAAVAGGGTAPRGATGGVSPILWLIRMARAHAKLDAYAHNPYPLNPHLETPYSGPCPGCATITMGTIGRLVRLVSHNFPRARIWLTEYGYQTNPPDPFLGVSPDLQARYASEGAYVAYRTPRVDVLIHFLYEDEPELGRFQSGLTTVSGARKPALAAFELPLAETRRRGTTTWLWGQLRAPGAGDDAVIERQAGSGWQVVARVRTHGSRIFRWRGRLAVGTVIRLRAGGLAGAPFPIE
jgi:hypothetical protein